MNFMKLPQLVDKRGKLPRKGSYLKRRRKITHRVWHHSLTLSHLAGSTAEAFANYHISLGWPGVGYHLIIEPKNIIQTSKGPRARIVYANDIDLSTYHIGNSNQFSLGICVAGDYRNEKMSDATKATIDELQEALVKDGIGSKDASHHQMPGYSWKACCVFNFLAAFKFLDGKTVPQSAPDYYTIQEGDTFWGIANNIDGITVNDLIAANPKVDPKKLRVGQMIALGKARKAPAKKPAASKANTNSSGIKFIGSIQIVGVKSAAIVMDKPDRNTAKNMGTLKKGTKVAIAGSVKGNNNPNGYWEVIYNGKRAYVSGQYGKLV